MSDPLEFPNYNTFNNSNTSNVSTTCISFSNSDPSSSSNSNSPLIQEYIQNPISITSYFNTHTTNLLQRTKHHFISLFPILTWIRRYNWTWFYGDLIAGITVGIVAVPQAMSYAKIATLPPEYGLYSSFVGVFIYCFFATSKDVCIGPVAVMSLQVSRTIFHVTQKYPELAGRGIGGPEIATTLALLCGVIATAIGFFRLGLILEFIPLPAVMGFMTGSAFSIIVGQIPGLFGLADVINTRESTFLVLVNFAKSIRYTQTDIWFGLPALIILFTIKYLCDYLTHKVPRYKIVWFYFSVLRNGIIIIVFTLISFACFKSNPENPPISLIKTVPSGLRNVGVPAFDSKIVSALIPEIPVSVIVLLLEHISIAKSFGRINNYKINPDQELVAIGVNNVVGAFFSAYPATGSFSRTALKAKCGVRTPIAGMFTGVVVLLALYALTSAFYWIPSATLCAVIIQAVFDLIVHPRVGWRLWRISPVEGMIFIAAVLISIFSTIETGIYFSICSSLLFLFLRIAKAHGQFLGRIEYYELVNPEIVSENGALKFSDDNENDDDNASFISHDQNSKIFGDDEVVADEEILAKNSDPIFDSSYKRSSLQSNGYSSSSSSSLSSPLLNHNPPLYTKKYKWVPLSLATLNPDLKVLPPPPGILVFRPNESFIYPNTSRQADFILDQVQKSTRPGVTKRHVKASDKLWNDDTEFKEYKNPSSSSSASSVLNPLLPSSSKPAHSLKDTRPKLRALIFDMSASPYIDATGVQNLVDTKTAINRYVGSDAVEYHFVGIMSEWSRRALVEGGFGKVNGHELGHGFRHGSGHGHKHSNESGNRRTRLALHYVDAAERSMSSLPYRGMIMEHRMMAKVKEMETQTTITGTSNKTPNAAEEEEEEGDDIANTREHITLFSILDGDDTDSDSDDNHNTHQTRNRQYPDEEQGGEREGGAMEIDEEEGRRQVLVPLVATNTPFFHFSMPDLDHLYRKWDKTGENDGTRERNINEETRRSNRNSRTNKFRGNDGVNRNNRNYGAVPDSSTNPSSSSSITANR